MQQYELSQRGAFHLNHNEDAYVIREIGSDKLLLAVMDGCSMGKESHFASTLLSKLLRKIVKEISYRDFIKRREKPAQTYLEEILEALFTDLRALKSQLHLEVVELLSTLIIGVLDKRLQALELLTVGDGLVCCNAQLFEYEQEDKPDYLGYHLAGDFKTWFAKQTQKLSISQVKDVSLSTDGIFSFKNYDGQTYKSIAEAEILHYLLIDKKGAEAEHMLQKKMLELERSYGISPSDDLTIVRILLSD